MESTHRNPTRTGQQFITISDDQVSLSYLKTRHQGAHGGESGELMFVTVRHGYPLEPQDIRKLMRLVAKRAKITKRVHPHILRHLLATNLMSRGTGILAIKEQLGHVYIATTMRYLHSAPARLQEEYRMPAPFYL
jgi:site-specific recombinase XerD